MIKKDILEQQKTFDNWKDKIKNRINDWKNELLQNEKTLSLDYSLESLNEIERILIKNYTLSSIENKDNNTELDGFVSYIGETLLNLIEDAEWGIYLDDKTNIFYGLPCVITKYSGSISVHFYLRSILTERTGNVLNTNVNKLLSYDNFIREQLKSDGKK